MLWKNDITRWRKSFAWVPQPIGGTYEKPVYVWWQSYEWKWLNAGKTDYEQRAIGKKIGLQYSNLTYG